LILQPDEKIHAISAAGFNTIQFDLSIIWYSG